MKESILPRMHSDAQDMVLGGIMKHVEDKKMVIVLGEPGVGKTTTLLDFCILNKTPTYYYRCSANTTMNSLLIFIANAIGIHVIGGNDEIQNRIQKKLQQTPDYCFVFDEAEYLTYGNGTKIDVLRQIYDETDVPIILCGTYVLKDLISGERKKNKYMTHNRPQIFRRLRKEEFDRIKQSEIIEYMNTLEKSYAVSFDTQTRAELITICRDISSGGLGNFIELIEIIFGVVRPEWKQISNQLNAEIGRVPHYHQEKSQTFFAIRPSKNGDDDQEPKTFLDDLKTATSETVVEHIDVTKLTVAKIDVNILKDAIYHKMLM